MSAFVHMDLCTGDPVAAKKFYKALLKWPFTTMKMPDGGGSYHGFKPEGGPGGGIGPKQAAEQATQWVPYVGVASVKKTIAKAQKLGATIVVPYQAIAGMGALGIFVDPTGATFGVWESAAPAAPSKPAKKAPAKKAAAKKAPAKKAAKKAK